MAKGKLEGDHLVMLFGSINRLTVGEVVDVDARVEHGDEEDEPGEKPRKPRPATQGVLEVCRINAREVAFGKWKPR